MKIWLVCGGRDFKDEEMLNLALDRLASERGKPDLLVEGDARGVDRMSGKWGIKNSIPVKPFPANWTKYGRAAGPIRNQEMLDYCITLCGDLVVIAFPGGTGTANMKNIADKAGVEVLEVDGSTQQIQIRRKRTVRNSNMGGGSSKPLY